jgi:hypothetical protein
LNPPLPFELAALQLAVNYQRWIADRVEPYLGARILEVGAGIGSMSRWLPLRERLILSERDPELVRLLEAEVHSRFGADSRVSVVRADLAGELPDAIVAAEPDTVVSFNVLEHIEDDGGALAKLSALLQRGSRPGRRRIVSFVPAHPLAYGDIDRTYGHLRRYTAASFAALVARSCPGSRLETRYFNAFGLPGWFVAGRILRRRSIGARLVRSLERLCPWIRPADDLLHAMRLPCGQSLIAVVTLPGAPA